MAARVLIINADDLGYSPEITRGIIESIKEGVVSSTTLIINGPYSSDAAHEAWGLPVGLHLNFSRWSRLSSRGDWTEAAVEACSAEEIAKEARAQIERFEQLLHHPPTHLDVHRHLHRHPHVLQGIADVASSRLLPVRSIDAEMRASFRARNVGTNDAFFGEAPADAYWTLTRLEQILAELPGTGIIELMCHPGYTPKLTATRYGAQREVELLTFTHPTARALLERLELIPVSFQAAFAAIPTY
jgi:predicted glycoside hydrolase/deacetylase ChbG (UPF0249 family)